MREAVGRDGGRAARLLAVLVALTALRHDPLPAQADTLPTGFGTLRRDDIALRFSTDQLEVQILPLDEQVIRLLASDTYRSLESLIRSRQAEVATQARRVGLQQPTLVMVTFHGLAAGARFVPEDLGVLSRGRLFRPQSIVPLSPTWSTLQLDQREQAVAIYLFEDGIGWFEDLTVQYAAVSNRLWTRSVQLLREERARVLARAQSQPARPNP